MVIKPIFRILRTFRSLFQHSEFSEYSVVYSKQSEFSEHSVVYSSIQHSQNIPQFILAFSILRTFRSLIQNSQNIPQFILSIQNSQNIPQFILAFSILRTFRSLILAFRILRTFRSLFYHSEFSEYSVVPFIQHIPQF